MAKIIVTAVVLPFVLFFALISVRSGDSATNKSADNQTESGNGTLQKMIVASGSATMEIDLSYLNGTSSQTQQSELPSSRGVAEFRFEVAPNSFFPILVFNDILRGAAQGSMGLIPQKRAAYPARLAASLNQLVIEKRPSSEQFDLVLRDERSGFVFFNIEGHLYDYDAGAQSLAIRAGRLRISEEFAKALGRPSAAGLVAGKFQSERRWNRSRSWSLLMAN